ncbi:restriction endonuclease subunit S [Cronobacter turicensis]|nr:restriction endonuclease subunit S [Cronobacter turicensis]
MAKYKAYPEYKDSGVEFLGRVPNEWSVKSLKNIVMIVNGSTPKSGVEEYWDGDINWITPTDLSQKSGVYLNDSQRKITNKGLDSCGTSLVPENTVILSTRAPIGSLAITGTQSCTNQGCKSLVVKNKESSLFLYYYLSISTSPLNNLGRGSTFLELSTEDLATFKVPMPNVGIGTIVSFLEHETAKIDNLIEKQQQLIELLKEKRQAVISHAVTKGLNPDVPMKDSGVEWLGDVPEHWIIKRLKHISPKVGVGLVINPSTYTKDEGVYFIFGGDVKEFGFDLTKTRRISPQDSNKLLPSRLNSRDLVSVRVGYPGITSVVTDDLEGSNCASIIIIRRGSYNSDWLCAAMNVWVGRQQVDLASYGAAQKQFNVSDAIEFIFPVPSINEQNDIADFVQKTLNKFDDLSQKALKQIELLQERRTALISAAVTGKIDVRDWVAPETQDVEAPQEATA